MNDTKKFIENEMSIIEEDFHKAFYMLLGIAKVFEEMLPKFSKNIAGTKDKKAIKYATKIKHILQQFNFFASEIEYHYKIEDKMAKEAYKAMYADIARIIGITIDQIRFERYDQLANLLIDFNQGNYAQVEEYLIDSLLDYEQSETLEGFGLVQRHAPNLTTDQKEDFCRDLVKWRDYSQIKK